VLFESIYSNDANAQKQAFADTWSNYSYMDELNQIAELHKDIYTALKTFLDLKKHQRQRHRLPDHDGDTHLLYAQATERYWYLLLALRPFHEPLFEIGLCRDFWGE